MHSMVGVAKMHRHASNSDGEGRAKYIHQTENATSKTSSKLHPPVREHINMPQVYCIKWQQIANHFPPAREMFDLERTNPPLLHHEISILWKDLSIITVPETKLEDTAESHSEDKPKVDKAGGHLPSFGQWDEGKMLASVPGTIHSKAFLQTLAVNQHKGRWWVNAIFTHLCSVHRILSFIICNMVHCFLEEADGILNNFTEGVMGLGDNIGEAVMWTYSMKYGYKYPSRVLTVASICHNISGNFWHTFIPWFHNLCQFWSRKVQGIYSKRKNNTVNSLQDHQQA